MGLHDLCDTGLVLGLGFPSVSTGENTSEKPVPAGQQKPDHQGKISEPSLSLSLSNETYDQICAVKKVDSDGTHHLSADLYRQESAASSFSIISVKREREMGSEEVEIERRISDEDDDGSNGRKKLRLTKVQSALLEESFKLHSTLNPKQKQDLAGELKLRPRQVEVWFQNRRARTKLKQTEVDCEFLKKCCETLTDENRRLQKELQELKALTLAQPLYMQLPAATLTMCPSCERIASPGSATTETAAKSPIIKAPKPQFYSPFTSDPPAAC